MPSSPPRSPSTILTTFHNLFTKTYLPDYLGFVLLQTLYFLTRYALTPAHRQFRLSDPSIQHPHADPERVSSWANFVYAGVVPLGVIGFLALLLPPQRARGGGISGVGEGGRWHKAHVSILGLLISISLTSFLTHLLKNAIGRPRPDLIARCIPALGTGKDIWVGREVCTNTNRKMVEDGWRSFPSGHSSFAFSGLGYFSAWLGGQVGVYRGRGDLLRVLVVGAPGVGALLVALSRVSDYRHDAYDVSVGGLLGMGVAGFVYRRYFRAWGDERCDEPWPAPGGDGGSGWRGEERERGLPKDEEEEVGMGVAGEGSAGEFDLDDLTEDEAERGGLLDGKRSAEGRGKQRDEPETGGGSAR